LDKKNAYVREGMTRIKELLENRGDTKLASGDWQGAQSEFKLALQYFPDDNYSKSRLQMAEAKAAETAVQQQQQQQNQRLLEEQQRRARVVALRQSALAAYRSGAHSKAIVEWQEYLKSEPNSDEAYFYLGASNMESKQLDTAILNFERAVALNPANGLAHLDLGLLYDRHRNDIPRAVEHLKKAKELGGADKYTPERLQTMINDLQTAATVAAMEKVPFPVEHKHAFSSCRGTLRVTDRGVEYRTTETDHSFYETYGGLRSFEISGDELTIRTRVNKKYTFRVVNPTEGERIRRIASRYTQISK
jgi:tetratricopeptide (TPR) repeat protein